MQESYDEFQFDFHICLQPLLDSCPMVCQLSQHPVQKVCGLELGLETKSSFHFFTNVIIPQVLQFLEAEYYEAELKKCSPQLSISKRYIGEKENITFIYIELRQSKLRPTLDHLSIV